MNKQQAQERMDTAAKVYTNRVNVELEGYDDEGILRHIIENAESAVLAAGFGLLDGVVWSREDLDAAREKSNGAIRSGDHSTASRQAATIKKAEQAAGISIAGIKHLKATFGI